MAAFESWGYRLTVSRARGKSTLSRDDWVKAAFETLNREGIDQVRVEPLAASLGVTKGSFYWHFRNRQDLLDALIEYWEKEMTQTVLDAAKVFHGSPEQRLINTFREIISKERTKYDPAVRHWAKFDPRVRQAVENIDKVRLSFLQGLFQDIGYDAVHAETRARLMYYYVMGESIVTIKEPMSKRLRMLNEKIRIIMQPLKSEETLPSE